MREHTIRSFQRYLRANISFFFNKKEVLDVNELKLISFISQIAKNHKPLEKQKRKKTHRIFSQKILDLVLQKKLINF